MSIQNPFEILGGTEKMGYLWARWSESPTRFPKWAGMGGWQAGLNQLGNSMLPSSVIRVYGTISGGAIVCACSATPEMERPMKAICRIEALCGVLLLATCCIAQTVTREITLQQAPIPKEESAFDGPLTLSAAQRRETATLLANIIRNSFKFAAASDLRLAIRALSMAHVMDPNNAAANRLDQDLVAGKLPTPDANWENDAAYRRLRQVAAYCRDSKKEADQKLAACLYDWIKDAIVSPEAESPDPHSRWPGPPCDRRSFADFD